MHRDKGNVFTWKLKLLKSDEKILKREIMINQTFRFILNRFHEEKENETKTLNRFANNIPVISSREDNDNEKYIIQMFF